MLVTLVMVMISLRGGESWELRRDIPDPSLPACLYLAQPTAAQWLRDHPGWKLSSWGCTIGNRRPERAT